MCDCCFDSYRRSCKSLTQFSILLEGVCQLKKAMKGPVLKVVNRLRISVRLFTAKLQRKSLERYFKLFKTINQSLKQYMEINQKYYGLTSVNTRISIKINCFATIRLYGLLQSTSQPTSAKFWHVIVSYDFIYWSLLISGELVKWEKMIQYSTVFVTCMPFENTIS